MLPGDMVGEYRIVAPLGRGGFGEVFSAVHPVIGKEVAIKLLRTTDEAAVTRFTAEATAVNKIAHPSIVDVFAFGEHAGQHYYVMELLRGTSLERFLTEHAPLPIADAMPILRAIAAALDAAHDAGFVHRDLKPDNVFLEGDGIKLIDFGLAKLVAPGAPGGPSQAGDIFGTPAYMAPEQCRGREVDRRTDIYALGVIAYRVLAGRLPFEGEDAIDTLLRQVHDEPAAPSSVVSLPPQIDAAVLAMLAKEAADRPATASAAIEALVAPARRARPAVWIAAIGAAAIVAAIGATRVAASDDEPARAAPPVATTVAAPPPPAAPRAAAPLVHLVIDATAPAEVELGDKSLGRTPVGIDVPKGSRAEIRLRARGYAIEQRSLDTSADRKLVIEMQPLRPPRTPGPDDLEDRRGP